MINPVKRICLLGFGEVGRILAEDLLQFGATDLVAWDRQFLDPDANSSRAFAELGVGERFIRARDAAVAAEGCQLVISAVTAAQDLVAAESILPGMPEGCWFLDLNSVSPLTKQNVGEMIESAGGRYVEAAVMSPIGPQRINTTMLLGGPNAREFLSVGQWLGFAGVQFCSEQLGQAAATKMCRSVIVKGMEALVTESLLAARYYGVDEGVVNSLHNLFPHPDWPEHARYLISRSLEHGERRAEEMREVAKTVCDAGLEPWMSSACAERQEWAAQFAGAQNRPGLYDMLAAIRAQLDCHEESEPLVS